MRPYRFKLNTNHDLAQGLVFAGLGNVLGTSAYLDSSKQRDDGFIFGFGTGAFWGTWNGAPIVTMSGSVPRGYIQDMTATPDAWTVAAHIRVDDDSTWRPLVGWLSSGASYPAIYPSLAAGGNCLLYMNGDNYRYFNTGPGLTDGNWHHVAISLPGAAQSDILGARMFVDGVEAVIGITAQGQPQAAKVTCNIGMMANARFFDGAMRDVMIWNTDSALEQAVALSDPDNYMLSGLIEKVPETKRFFSAPPQPTNLRILHTSRKPKTRPQRFRVNPEHAFAQGLVFAGLGNTPGSLYYHDSSVERNHGALVNMSPSGWVDDSYLGRRAMQFAGGVSSEHVAAPYPLPPADDNLSVLLWAKPRGTMVRQGIIGDDTIFDNWGIGCWSSLGELRCYSGSGDTRWIGNPGDLESDVWNHYAFLWESNLWRVYKNGIELIPSENNAATGSGTATTLLIGHRLWTAAPWEYFDGWIADPMVYDHALELDEVFQLAERGNVMLSGLIEPLRDPPSYFFTEPPIEAITGIFEPLVIGV